MRYKIEKIKKFTQEELRESMEDAMEDAREQMEHQLEEGFLPEAAINFLAMLGWNPGTEKEMFSILGIGEGDVMRLAKSS